MSERVFCCTFILSTFTICSLTTHPKVTMTRTRRNIESKKEGKNKGNLASPHLGQTNEQSNEQYLRSKESIHFPTKDSGQLPCCEEEEDTPDAHSHRDGNVVCQESRGDPVLLPVLYCLDNAIWSQRCVQETWWGELRCYFKNNGSFCVCAQMNSFNEERVTMVATYRLSTKS